MKRFSVVTALAMGLCLCMVAGKRIVNYPFISYTNTSIIDISRVELSDTATIVTFDATFRPKKSIKLSSDAVLETNGKEYALKSSRNIVPGENYIFPKAEKHLSHLYSTPFLSLPINSISRQVTPRETGFLPTSC